MAESILTRRTKVELEYILLADIIVDTATTTIDITGLDIGKDDEILMVADINNTTGSGASCRLFINNNTTVTNYYVQTLEADNTTISSARTNTSSLIYTPAGRKTLVNAQLKLTNNGYVTYQADNSYSYDLNIRISERFHTTTFTVASITQLTLLSSVTDGIGVGSRITLYKKGGSN